MRIVARRPLREFWTRNADAEQPLRAWYDDAKRARWRSPAAIKQTYANASIVGDDRVVFNIKGYRLEVAISYPYGVCYIRFIDGHDSLEHSSAVRHGDTVAPKAVEAEGERHSLWAT